MKSLKAKTTLTITAIIVVVVIAIRYTSRITKPLEDITNEVGVLTSAFSQLISNLRIYINDLSNLAYTDALTSVHNKGAFDIKIKNLQEAINEPWDKIDVARSMAIYDPAIDIFANDVARRADKLMYENKHERKDQKAEEK